jgi:bifunctional DNA-binding transcriptional regulator/antitoxin component of YhaV-PrlF toxin-antitoxin module
MKAIRLYFEKKEDNKIVFKTEEDDEIIIPSKYIDFELQEGSSIYFKIQKKLVEEENKKEIARAVLEEILNGEE